MSAGGGYRSFTGSWRGRPVVYPAQRNKNKKKQKAKKKGPDQKNKWRGTHPPWGPLAVFFAVSEKTPSSRLSLPLSLDVRRPFGGLERTLLNSSQPITPPYNMSTKPKSYSPIQSQQCLIARHSLPFSCSRSLAPVGLFVHVCRGRFMQNLHFKELKSASQVNSSSEPRSSFWYTKVVLYCHGEREQSSFCMVLNDRLEIGKVSPPCPTRVWSRFRRTVVDPEAGTPPRSVQA